MKIGVIADDFTGASDIALTLAEAGMRTAQYVGIPDQDAQDVDAGVVSLKSRTIPAHEAVALSLAACDWLLAQGASQIIFKVCSTFDSTPAGNIGPVAAALAARLEETHIITCPAFPENGRSVYQGHLFVNDGLLNESGMQDHPLTPMTDSDLRRVLASQTEWAVTHTPMRIVQEGGEVVADYIAALPPSMVIVDAIADNDLIDIAVAAKDRKLLTGGSGIAIGLPANFGATPSTPMWAAETGAGVILSGSCSRATREQVSRYSAIAPSRMISAADAIGGNVDLAKIVSWVLESDVAPLIYTSADPEDVKAAQNEFGTDKAAHAIETLFAQLAKDLVKAGARRVIVAGGETSGAVVEALRPESLVIGPRLAAGVPALKAGDVSLALKSGNFGGPDFFADGLARMAQNS